MFVLRYPMEYISLELIVVCLTNNQILNVSTSTVERQKTKVDIY